MVEFLLRGGWLFDSLEGIFRCGSLYVDRGVIVEAPEDGLAKNVIDCTGKYVVPGLIDEHLHIDLNGSMIGANADTVCVPNGITTACDGGTCGASNFPAFYNMNIIRYETHTYSMLNVSTFGNKSLCIHNEDHDPADFRPDLIEAMFRKYPETLRALKVRMCRATLGGHGMAPLHRTLEISEELQAKGIRCPVVVHYDDLPDNVTVAELFGALRPGDTVAHVYQTHRETIFLPDGTVHPAVRAARERGVLMDSCHGRVHWSVDHLKKAVREDFLPDIISSDTVRISEYIRPGFSLLYAMCVENACGVPMEKVLQCVTINPARALGIDAVSGILEPGRPADVTVLDIPEGGPAIHDMYGGTVEAAHMFIPLLTMISGRVAYRQIFF